MHFAEDFCSTFLLVHPHSVGRCKSHVWFVIFYFFIFIRLYYGHYTHFAHSFIHFLGQWLAISHCVRLILEPNL